MTDLDLTALRKAYDAQLRAHIPDSLPAGVTIERDGPLVRYLGMEHGGFLTYTDLGGLSGDELDMLIARQREIFSARGEQVEWKLHGHDEPADLAERLRAAGFEPEAQETVLVGPVAPLAATLPVPPEGVRLREVTARADLDRIAEMEEAVWGDGSRRWLASGLEKEIAADPQSITVVVAEAGEAPPGERSRSRSLAEVSTPPASPGDRTGDNTRPGGDNTQPGGGTRAGESAQFVGEKVVSAGWVRYVPGTGFATLWGGSTRPEWRQQGIYKALVTYRARLAAQRGYSYLQVDASDNSRPILERLGFVAVTTTTPYVLPGSSQNPG